MALLVINWQKQKVTNSLRIIWRNHHEIPHKICYFGMIRRGNNSQKLVSIWHLNFRVTIPSEGKMLSDLWEINSISLNRKHGAVKSNILAYFINCAACGQACTQGGVWGVQTPPIGSKKIFFFVACLLACQRAWGCTRILLPRPPNISNKKFLKWLRLCEGA